MNIIDLIEAKKYIYVIYDNISPAEASDISEIDDKPVKYIESASMKDSASGNILYQHKFEKVDIEPTFEETISAQVLYTAVATDTYLGEV